MKRVIFWSSLLAAAAAGIAGSAQTLPSPDALSRACSALPAGKSLAKTHITRTALVAAANGVPAHCEVQAEIRPVKSSRIGVVYRLPLDWNRKILALGGGGWMGNTSLQAATEGLGRGYATLQTDAGHTTGTAFDASPWGVNADGSPNKPALEDFSHRAIHLMTTRGKDVVKAYYGQAAHYSYYQGCSTGGRMGLMEVQRHPQDFDGVIAGAPVYTLQTQTSAQLRSLAFAAPDARLTAPLLALVNRAVLSACDAQDGAADGVVRDPRACGFDPASLACKPGQAAESCLAPGQVASLQKVYAGEKTAAGMVASYPLEKGGETGWARFIPATGAVDAGTASGGMHALRGPLLGDPQFDMNSFTTASAAKVRDSWLAKTYEAKNPDIRRFVRAGGKLILWHGFNDPGPSARGTIEYHEAVRKATRNADSAVRTFMLPGVAHCSGGTGPDRINWLAAMENWVEKGQAPEQLPATKAGSTLAWNVCAWPALPTGQPDGSYACR